MKKKLLLVSIALCLTSHIAIATENEGWMNYFYSKWNDFTNSPYVRLIQEKTLSYMVPTLIIISGTVIGRTVASKTRIEPVPQNKYEQKNITRKNEGIIRGWGIVGGLTALATYKTYEMIKHYLQKPTAKSNEEATPDNK